MEVEKSKCLMLYCNHSAQLVWFTLVNTDRHLGIFRIVFYETTSQMKSIFCLVMQKLVLYILIDSVTLRFCFVFSSFFQGGCKDWTFLDVVHDQE